MADLGFGVQPAAQQFALDFIPVIDEDYLFACDRDKLDDARLGGVLEILRSDAFRDSVAHLEGYDPVFLRAAARTRVGPQRGDRKQAVIKSRPCVLPIQSLTFRITLTSWIAGKARWICVRCPDVRLVRRIRDTR